MQDKLYIKNKNLKTEIFIKKNYIPTFIKKISQKKEKVFCIIDSKIKIHLKLKKFKNIKIISVNCGEKIKEEIYSTFIYFLKFYKLYSYLIFYNRLHFLFYQLEKN